MTGKTTSPHPQDTASFPSKILFWWIFPLLWKGARDPLNHEDLYPIRGVDESGQRTDRLEQKWHEEMLCARGLGKEPKFWRAIFRYFTVWKYMYFVLSGFANLLGDNIVWYSTIKLLRQLTGIHDNESSVQYFIYIYGIAIGSLIKLIGQNHLHLHGAVLGVRARAAILGLLYKKVLRLSQITLDSGHVLELVCNDSQRVLFTSAQWFIPYAIRYAMYGVCLVAWLLYFIGWQIIPGTLFLLALAIVRVVLHKYDYQLRKKASQFSDKRLGIIRESLTLIRSLKLNCWEEIYQGNIKKTHWQEVKLKAKRWIVMLTCYSFISCGQHLATFITVVVLVMTQKENMSNLNFFAIIALFHALSEVLCLCLPTAVRYITDVRTALERIEIFLKNNEFFKIGMKNEKYKTPYISLHKVTCELPQRSLPQSPESSRAEILKNITLNVTQGLVLICGPVGSGKSSLLTTVLGGELLVTNGSVKYSGTVAYVSDTPWVFLGTIRENILFGLAYMENLYSETIRACQLEKDLKSFPKGDLSLIGEHGETISGGQRTRIALARAVYSQADIYLLDDPLSSLDANVGENVFRQCIKGLLANKIVLLTSHDTRYYREADRIIHLKDGKIEDEHSLVERELEEKSATRETKTAKDVWCDPGKHEKATSLKQEEEDREYGRVAFKVYKEYFLYGASAIVLFIISIVFLSGQGLTVLVDFKASRLPELVSGQGDDNFNHALFIYTLCLIAGVILVVIGTLFVFLVLMNAAYKVHSKMVECLFKAPLSFYAVNPVGRVINRFSQDMNSLEELLPFFIFVLLHYAAPAIATIVLAVITTPLLLVPIFLALPVFYFFSQIFFTSATDIKRLMSIGGGPIYSHFSNTMAGLRSIRVYGKQRVFTEQIFRYIDDHHRAVLCSYTAIRWFANVFSIVCVTLATIITVIVVNLVSNSLWKDIAAITILYAVSTTQMIDYLVRVAGDVNQQMTSAERVLAYTKITPEPGHEEQKPPPRNWPDAGEIEFRNVSLWYYTGSPKSLKNISFKINSSEKVGISGRTGAGKSSLVAALMRMAETRGKIIIDGLDIKKINVLSTRKYISVIAQSPSLINGTIRLNLDPLGQHTDTEIWQALNRTKMTYKIQNLPKGLDSELNTDNSSFSVGEKQLLNLARVLLQRNKIIVFDEATGKIDGNTDEEIKGITGNVLKECTVITIAHRLSTILNCDRVMVLDQGEIKEFDRPDVLLNKPNGLLKQLQEIL